MDSMLAANKFQLYMFEMCFVKISSFRRLRICLTMFPFFLSGNLVKYFTLRSVSGRCVPLPALVFLDVYK